MRTFRLLLVISCLTACASSAPAPKKAQAEQAFGDPQKLLFWTPEQQLAGYKNVERIYNTRSIPAGASTRALPKGAALSDVSYEVEGARFNVDGFIKHNHVVGLLVIKNGKVALERYERGNDASTRWISFSVTKSIVSLLIGAAIQDGHITAITDPVTKYLPKLKGTVYEGVTVENVLQMASGVKWNENYADPDSDLGKTARFTAPQHIEYLAARPRVAEPGARFNYNTGETHLVGAILRAAIGGHLAPYLSKKIWKPFGMQQEAVWPVLQKDGAEYGGCCIAATLRDYGRIGMFTLAKGKLEDGTEVLPKGWIERSTTPSKGYPGYGYLWWLSGETYSAAGIFGQAIFVSPKDGLVIATHSMWPQAVGKAFSAHRAAFFAAVAQALR